MVKNMFEKKPKEILDDICKDYGITLEDLKSERRFGIFVMARKEAAFRLRQLRLSYQSIGILLGGRDHATIIYYLSDLKR